MFNFNNVGLDVRLGKPYMLAMYDSTMHVNVCDVNVGDESGSNKIRRSENSHQNCGTIIWVTFQGGGGMSD